MIAAVFIVALTGWAAAALGALLVLAQAKRIAYRDGKLAHQADLAADQAIEHQAEIGTKDAEIEVLKAEVAAAFSELRTAEEEIHELVRANRELTAELEEKAS